jgi:hypothetical protein
MRSDWVPLSASALVVGAMCLVLGTLLNPTDSDATATETLRAVEQGSARYLAMAVVYVFGSISLTLGLPAVLTLFERRARRFGLVAVAVLSVGTIGTCGFGMLMAFFRALVVTGALESASLGNVSGEAGLTIFVYGWVAGFYCGILLLALALLVARATPRWVPGLLVLFVVVQPLLPQLGRVGTALQVMALALAFTGVATKAVTLQAQRPATSLSPR